MAFKNSEYYLEIQDCIFSTLIGTQSAMEKINHVLNTYKGHYYLREELGIDYIQNLTNPITAAAFPNHIKEYLLDACEDQIEDIRDVKFEIKGNNLTVNLVIILREEYRDKREDGFLRLGLDVI